MAQPDPQPTPRTGVAEVNHGAASRRLSRGRLWCFRLLAAVLVPAVLLSLVELALRLLGAGYPTGFLLASRLGPEAVFVQNDRFGWRFFGRDLARWPCPFSLTQTKSTNIVRILVLGESAARGEPQPDFGLPRMLEALLSLRYPGVRFEVVNAAMTAINSHAILPIARDCVPAQADIWVLYIGNNEVVGPFGAGTVFGSQTLPLPLIRASLALKATRSGQWLERGLEAVRPSPADDTVWGGMAMFLGQQVRADDSRMRAVYSHFERNLTDIVATGRRTGAGIVLSTVAVNLKDCPPFASMLRPGMAQRARWEECYQQGIAAQAAGRLADAEAAYREAAGMDSTHAELQFRLGQCAVAAGNFAAAREHFQAACDQDTLRFRCDSQLNTRIRHLATNYAGGRVLLADAERALTLGSAGGSPGEQWFYEHVHLTFAGNHLLATVIAEEVKKLLPAWAAAHEAMQQWPGVPACAQRLGWSRWQEAAALNSIAATLNDPPFTGQWQHQERMQQLEATLADCNATLQAEGVGPARAVVESALRLAPLDAVLQKQAATLGRVAGDLSRAEAAARRALELLPNDPEGWALLGSILAGQQKLVEAEAAYRRAFQFGPQGVRSHLELAGALVTLGRSEEAVREYRSLLKQKPRCVPALLQLGQVVEQVGRKAEAADYFRRALTNRSQRLPELVELGGVFQRRGDFAAAAEVYRDAVRLSGGDPQLQLGAARALAALGHYEAASVHSAECVRLAPAMAEAHLMHGIVLWRRGRSAEAEAQFQEAMRLQPDSLDARLNLGTVWAHQGRRAEALGMFEQVLERNPTNAMALRSAAALRGARPPPPAAGPN